MNDLCFISTKSDFIILKLLSRDRNIFIAKSDKECGAVLLNKADIQKNV